MGESNKTRGDLYLPTDVTMQKAEVVLYKVIRKKGQKNRVGILSENAKQLEMKNDDYLVDVVMREKNEQERRE